MAWADFWEMLDGRIWWEMRKSGAPEKRVMTPKRIAADRDWLAEKAKATFGVS